jgi:hypothetical protein
MGALSIAALLVKLAPTILSIIEKSIAALHDRQMIDAGKAQAIAAQSAKLSETIAKAGAGAREAAARAAADPTDIAFDSDFKRSE